MAAVTFPVARGIVLAKCSAAALGRTIPGPTIPSPTISKHTIERVALELAAGRVLAEEISADRDCPALPRSVRDGYAVRAVDLPGELLVIGEVRAGERYQGELGAGQAIEIMTGAPIPAGADTVVMVEHTRRAGDHVQIDGTAALRQFINPQGCEAESGRPVLAPGKRLDYTDIAMLAAFGHAHVEVYQRPEVAIIATGDEIVEVGHTPAPHQIRNSNAHSLAVQVARAGGIPRVLPIARDNVEHTRSVVEQGLACDLLLLSGGVSAGKYDIVEQVLTDCGAEIFFDRVLIQPGQPLVFGQVRGKFFFGLPGNPSSTMVTFELFARAALELLAGQTETPLFMPFSRLTRDFRHRAGLTRFLPAHLNADATEVTPVEWHGSGDIPALTRANAYLVADPFRAEYARGEMIQVLVK